MNSPRSWTTLLILLALLLPALPAAAAQPLPTSRAVAPDAVPGPLDRGDSTVPLPAPIAPAQPDSNELPADFTWTPLTPTAGQVITLTGWVAGRWLSSTIYQQEAAFPSLALDPLGQPHVSFLSFNDMDGLGYAYYDGTNWQAETIDPGAYVGWMSSLVVDEAGYPHIGYTDGERGLARYASYDGTSWTFQTIEDNGPWGVSGGSSLALDSLGRPHVVYVTYSNLLTYARYDGATWITETVSGGAGLGGDRSLALDALDRPHIISCDMGMHYRYYDGTEWITQTVEPGSCNWAALALDSAGYPHIAYDRLSSNDTSVHHAWYDGATWHTETVESGLGINGGIPSLVLDGQDHPHLSYADDSRQLIRYAYYDGASWHIQNAAPAAPSYNYPTALSSLALDANEHPHIVHRQEIGLGRPLMYTQIFPADPPYTYNWGLGDGEFAVGPEIHHAYIEPGSYVVTLTAVAITGTGAATHTITVLPPPCEPVTAADFTWSPPIPDAGSPVTLTASATGAGWGGWVTQTVSGGGGDLYGAAPSLALDETGNPRVTFWGGMNVMGLKYAHYDGSWHVEEAAPYGDIPSLALDSAGRPHVTISHAGQSFQLKYGYNDGTAWLFETVDDWVILFSSLALDAADRPHISYSASVDPWSNEPFELHYTVLTGTTWLTQTVDDGGNVRFSDLALDTAGHPHIVYQDDLNQEIRYAWYDGASWYTVTVDSIPTGSEISGVAIALDAAGHPHLGYTDNANLRLKYAWHDGTSWHVETVVDGIQFGNTVSLALDSLGRPHLAYAGGDYSIRHAYKDGQIWQVERIDTGGSVHSFGVSLALDASDRSHLTYHVAGTDSGEMRYAEQIPGYATPPISYDWDLGDGDTAGGETITHTYAQPGAYTVTLTASNCTTATATAAHTIPVLAIPCDPVTTTDFTWTPLTPTAGTPVTFTGEAWVNKWVSEGVETGTLNAWNRLVIDPAGWPHLAYYDVLSHTVRYAWKNNAGWHSQAVTDDMGEGNHFCDLALDSLGQPHISYFNPSSGAIEYASYDGSTWQTEEVMYPSAPAFGPVSLALDNQDRPHISFGITYGGPDIQTLYYLHYDGWWQIEIVDSGPASFWSSLALDQAGHPHLAYRGCPVDHCHGEKLMYAHNDGTSWQIQVVNSTGSTAPWLSLALDGLGQPRIAYSSWRGEVRGLQYAYLDGTNWVTQTLDIGTEEAVPSLALDGHGYPHIAYSTNFYGIGAMRYTYYDGTYWRRENTDSGVWYGSPSLVIDAEGRRYLAYSDPEARYAEWLAVPTPPLTYTWDFGDGTMGAGITTTHTYAAPGTYTVTLTAANSCSQAMAMHTVTVLPSCEPITPTDFAWTPLTPTVGQVVTLSAMTGTWVTETLPIEGLHPSLALDAQGFPHLGYGTDQGLGYAYYDGARWVSETVDSGGMNADLIPSLALDAAGRPHISYTSWWGLEIRYAFYDGTGWVLETIDSSSFDIGRATSLALDASGQPHVVYSVHTSQDDSEIRYAYRDGSTWFTQTIAAGVSVHPRSLALDAAGRPYLTYATDASPRATWYAYYDGTSWVTQPIFNDIVHVSMALDTAGYPHVGSSAWSENPSVLYSWSDGASWYTTTVEGNLRPDGGYPDLALGAVGRPHLVYVTYRPGPGSGLKYASYTGSAWNIRVVDSNIGGPATDSLSSLVLGPDGQPHIAYVFAIWPTGLLRYAYLAGPTQPISYTWDLGDGATATGEVITHTYTQPGVYTVTLAAGDCTTVTHPITVVAPPVCEPVQVLDVTPVVSGCVVTFSGEVTGTAPVSWLWTFGDGVTSTLDTPVHVYTASGVYAGTVQVWNCSGDGHDEWAFTVTVDCTVPPAVYKVYLPLVFKTYR